MARPSFIDQIARRIQDGVPLDTGLLGEDFGKTVRAAVAGAVERLELVSREEFDVQAELLARTRARVEELEQRVAALEREVLGTTAHGSGPEAAALPAAPAGGEATDPGPSADTGERDGGDTNPDRGSP